MDAHSINHFMAGNENEMNYEDIPVLLNDENDVIQIEGRHSADDTVTILAIKHLLCSIICTSSELIPLAYSAHISRAQTTTQTGARHVCLFY